MLKKSPTGHASLATPASPTQHIAVLADFVSETVFRLVSFSALASKEAAVVPFGKLFAAHCREDRPGVSPGVG